MRSISRSAVRRDQELPAPAEALDRIGQVARIDPALAAHPAVERQG